MLANVTIGQAMTSEVITLRPLDTFDNAEKLFAAHNIHHLPVVDKDGKIVGIISKSDYHSLCDRFTLFSKSLGDRINESYFSSLLAKEVMKENPVCLPASSSLSVALGIFQKNLFHAIPVVSEDKKLIGILSTLDIINYLSLQLAEQPAVAS